MLLCLLIPGVVLTLPRYWGEDEAMFDRKAVLFRTELYGRSY